MRSNDQCELETASKHVAEKVKKDNLWYTDDQFAVQFGSPGMRSSIEHRWSFFESEIERWYADSNAKQHLRVLDAGCGDGINLFGLSQILNRIGASAKLFGMDYNSLRLSRALSVEGVEGVVEGSLLDIPLESCFMDIILCNHVLEHIEEDGQVLSELFRVLAPGGLLILGVPNEGCMLARLRNHIFQRSILQSTDHVNFYTMSQVKGLLCHAGFDVIGSDTQNFFFPHERLHYFMVERQWGRRLIQILKAILPGQAAGLTLVARKSTE